jgi:hypothetical protein
MENARFAFISPKKNFLFYDGLESWRTPFLVSSSSDTKNRMEIMCAAATHPKSWGLGYHNEL